MFHFAKRRNKRLKPLRQKVIKNTFLHSSHSTIFSRSYPQYLFVQPSDMPLRAQFAEIRTFSHCFQLRVLLKKLPCLILGIVANLLLPRVPLASPVPCVGMQGGVGCFVRYLFLLISILRLFLRCNLSPIQTIRS